MSAETPQSRDSISRNDNEDESNTSKHTDSAVDTGSGEQDSVRYQVQDTLAELLGEKENVDRDYAVLHCCDAIDDCDKGTVEDLVNELAVTDKNGHVESVTSGGVGIAGNDPEDIPSWEGVRHTYDASTGKEAVYSTVGDKHRMARHLATMRLLHKEGYIVYISEETGESDVYRYNDESGRYEKDEGGLKNLIKRKLGPQYESGEYREILDQLEALGRCGYHDVNARHMDGMYICTNNCVLRIDEEGADGPWDWEVLEHDPEYRFIGYSVDVDWPFVEGSDVEADWKGTLDWLRSMFDDDYSFKVLCEIFGASLRDDQKFKAFAGFGGRADAGKSKVAEAWTNVVTMDNIEGVQLHTIAEDPFASSEFFRSGGAMVNIGTDIPEKQIENTSPLKTYTTNDVTSHNVKFDTRFKGIVPCFNIQIFNDEPVISTDAGAIASRMKYLYFPYRFISEHRDDYSEDADDIKEADPELESKLASQPRKNALFVFAMEGLYRLYQSDGTFSFEKSESERWGEYCARADTVESFMRDCVRNSTATNDNGLDVYLTHDELHEMYKEWAKRHSRESKSRKAFIRYVKDVSSHRVHSQRTRKTSDDDDRESVFWGLAPSGKKGWSVVEDHVRARMVSEFDIVPDRTETSSNNSGSSDSVEDVSDDANEILKTISSREMSDTREPTIPGVIGQSGVSPQDAQRAIGELLAEGKIRIDGELLRTGGGDNE